MTWPKPLEPGDRAPSFMLPSVHRDGTITLDDYRGRSHLMVGFFRGLACPFCRRQIAQLAACHDRLQEAGVDSVGIVITPVGRGRLYFRYHPARIPLAADETAVTHRAFGVPRFEVLTDNDPDAAEWPRTVTIAQVESLRINPGGIFPEPVLANEAAAILNRADAFEPTDEDIQVHEQTWTQLDGLFLIDRNGVVRWRYLEAIDDPTGLGTFPSEDELLAAASALSA
jgi:peroxiredoxin